jgi:hypothetical protein
MGLSPALWPILRFLTRSPILTMTPAPSWPAHLVPNCDLGVVSIFTPCMEVARAYIGGMPQSSIMKWTSDIHRPVTLSLIRTSSGPISGTGKS